LIRRLALVALLLGLSACREDGDATLVIVVTASGSPLSVTTLKVTLSSNRAGESENRYSRDGQQPISFPTTLSARLPTYAAGDLTIDVEAEDASGRKVAAGNAMATVGPGEQRTVYVQLECDGAACVVDGGVVDPDGGMPTPSPRCGNGRVDPGETCDTAIIAGMPGACPADCDDHIPCTRDKRTGSDCTVRCDHDEEIRDPAPGDGCCPTSIRADKDPDCSASCGNGVVDPGETCDTAIPRDTAGACPTSCPRAGSCVESRLISSQTCSAVCARYPIVVQSGRNVDNCCPPGATNAVDIDCDSACGNGLVEAGETCDVGIPQHSPGACPTSCDDGDPRTIDFFLTAGCQPACNHFEITTPVSGDGWCPSGYTHAQDTDCPALCGNGVVERGESCDPPGTCPTSCPLPPSRTGHLGCMRAAVVGDPYQCVAHCAITEISACDLDAPDDCCPTGCTWMTDIDCPAVCGDGLRSTTLGEECDIAAPAGNPLACPTTCSDGDPCTEDRLVSAGTCAARCVFLPITAFRAGDGCCPPAAGANFTLDPDCKPICGNGVVETPAELCDYGVGACPGPSCSCPGPEACPQSAFCTRYVVRGDAEDCSSACVAMPITQCASGDNCCPAGCSTANDSDCRVTCGDGVVEGTESCDRGITAGHQGACLGTCDDGNACTVDVATGSTEGCTRTCSNHPIVACIADDGCCPAGCSAASDRDCAPVCNDGRIGAGETCDPPSTCATSCPDDGDPCTAEQLSGSAATCNTTCRHVPITACSDTVGDTCCPTGCTAANDWDCI
jgi:hypothetical protein